MKDKKVLSVLPRDDITLSREVLLESYSVDELKAKGAKYALSRGVVNPRWLDVSFPSMGEVKFSDARLRYSMDLDSEMALLIE